VERGRTAVAQARQAELAHAERLLDEALAVHRDFGDTRTENTALDYPRPRPDQGARDRDQLYLYAQVLLDQADSFLRIGRYETAMFAAQVALTISGKSVASVSTPRSTTAGRDPVAF
jgi:hypothetical protein